MSLIFNVVFSFFLFMGMIIGSGKVTAPRILLKVSEIPRLLSRGSRANNSWGMSERTKSALHCAYGAAGIASAKSPKGSGSEVGALSENPSGLLQDLFPNDHAPTDVEGSFSAQDEDFLRRPNSAQIQSEICKTSKVVACLLIPLGIFVVMGRKDWREQNQEQKI